MPPTLFPVLNDLHLAIPDLMRTTGFYGKQLVKQYNLFPGVRISDFFNSLPHPKLEVPPEE